MTPKPPRYSPADIEPLIGRRVELVMRGPYSRELNAHRQRRYRGTLLRLAEARRENSTTKRELVIRNVERQDDDGSWHRWSSGVVGYSLNNLVEIVAIEADHQEARAT